MVTRYRIDERRRKLHALVAEDDTVNQKVAVRILEKNGCSATVVSTGREAIEALKKDKFDLVLMDVQMPDMDGIEATRLIRNTECGTRNEGEEVKTSAIENPQSSLKRIPIIALTAHAMKGDRERFLEAGMDDYVSKPLEVKVLMDTIDRLVQGNDEEKPGTNEQLKTEPKKATVADPEIVSRSEAAARLDGDETLLNDVCKEFTRIVPQKMKQLRQALKQENESMVEQLAHSLKGTAGTVGAGPMKDEAFRMELAARKKDLGKAEALFARLGHEVEKVLNTISD